jgi:hypothetical protein
MTICYRIALAGLLAALSSSALAFTNQYEPRVMHFAGISEPGPIQFSWTGAELRSAEVGGVVDGEILLKVWGEQGGCGQVVLCVDLRAVPPHPELPECRDRRARLMPLYMLYDGPLTPRSQNHYVRKKFCFRVNMPQPFRMHDLRLVALRAPNGVEAVTIIREDLTIQELRDRGEKMGLQAVPEMAGKEAWNVANVGRLFLWDAANEMTVPYQQRYPGYPELFRPILPPRAECCCGRH